MKQIHRSTQIAEAIIEYFRKECAISTSDGIETSGTKLAPVINASQPAACTHLRRMVDLGIIVLKKTTYYSFAN